MADRRKILAAGALAAAILSGAGWLAHLDLRKKISTDVLDLIPVGERTPELALVRELADKPEARVMLFALTAADGHAPPAEVTRRFAATLAADPTFAEAVDVEDTAGRDAMARELYERRFELLFPLWLRDREAEYARRTPDAPPFEAWLAKSVADRLGAFLASPSALAFRDLVPSDPLLLLPDAVDRLKVGLALLPHGADERPAAGLVWARIAASPLSDEGQDPVFAAVARATAEARAAAPGLTVASTGVNRFAAASKARIRYDVSWLNLVSIAAVLAVALVFLRSLLRGLHLAPPILVAVLGAWTAVTLAFSPVHILVFAVGSLLTGVAIDYGFYIFLQPPAEPGEDYWRKIRRLLEPLLASCFTTVAGFALLVVSPLPLIRQLGLFVSAGLLSALGTAILYFSLLSKPFLESRGFRGGQSLPPPLRRGLRYGLIALWIAALPGLLRLNWRDDIRGLEVPAPALQQEDARIRGQFGDNGQRAVWLTYAPTLLEARENWSRFQDWLGARGLKPDEGLSAGLIMPTAAEHRRAVQFARDATGFAADVRAALENGGFDADAFAPFFTAYQQFAAAKADDATLSAAVAALQAKMAGPASLLVHQGTALSWLVTIMPGPAPADAPPPALHTISASQLQSLNQVFARYRQSALRLSLIGLAIVGAGVFLTYGLRRGPRIFSIPCGSCLGIFGLYGWWGLPLNLFHLLGAFLGVCLTHNYSIFSATSAHRHEAPPMSVRLSALTTMASFGVLGLSGIPVVRALGGTVALMVLAALLVIEFEHFAPRPRDDTPSAPP